MFDVFMTDDGVEFGDKILYFRIELIRKRRKRRIVWDGWLGNWQDCDASVNHNAKPDPPNHDKEDGMIGIPQQDKKASEEKEDGKM
jgi:hypothetical protein